MVNETDKILIYWQPLLACAGFLLTLVGFFLKRTLNKIETNQNNMFETIKANEKNNVDRYTKLASENEERYDKFSDDIGKKLDKFADKTDKQIAKIADDQSKLEKEFYEFKENVAKNYTKQEDFSSQTRDINKKLDNISAVMNKIEGKIDGKV